MLSLSNCDDEESLTLNYSDSSLLPAGRVCCTVAIGAMIIKHLKKLSDEETIEEIKENPYLQYFLGYEDYSMKQAFDLSLFVTIRNRMGFEAFMEFNEALIKSKCNASDGKGIKYSGKALGHPPKETEENRETLRETKEQLKKY